MKAHQFLAIFCVISMFISCRKSPVEAQTLQDFQVGISTGKNFNGSTSWGNWDSNYDLHFADLNGDGKADLVGRDQTGMLIAGISNGSGFDTSLGSWSQNYWINDYSIGFADMNGDGKSDVIGMNRITGDIQVGESSGDNFIGSKSWGIWEPSYDLQFADVNGDGKCDLIGRNGTGMLKVGISNGSGFSISNGSWNENYWQMEYSILFADMDGDGRKDIVGRHLTTGDVQVGLSTGEKFLGSTTWGSWDTDFDLFLADINGDGKADLIGRNKIGMIMAGISTGIGFSTTEGQWNQNYWIIEYNMAFADMDGDAKADLVGLKSGGTGYHPEELSFDYGLYPNPSNGTAFIEIIGTIGKGMIRITDLIGRQKYVKEINESTSGKIYLEVGRWGKGIYLVGIQVNNQVISKRMIVN